MSLNPDTFYAFVDDHAALHAYMNAFFPNSMLEMLAMLKEFQSKSRRFAASLNPRKPLTIVGWLPERKATKTISQTAAFHNRKKALFNDARKDSDAIVHDGVAYMYVADGAFKFVDRPMTPSIAEQRAMQVQAPYAQSWRSTMGRTPEGPIPVLEIQRGARLGHLSGLEVGAELVLDMGRNALLCCSTRMLNCSMTCRMNERSRSRKHALWVGPFTPGDFTSSPSPYTDVPVIVVESHSDERLKSRRKLIKIAKARIDENLEQQKVRNRCLRPHLLISVHIWAHIPCLADRDGRKCTYQTLQGNAFFKMTARSVSPGCSTSGCSSASK